MKTKGEYILITFLNENIILQKKVNTWQLNMVLFTMSSINWHLLYLSKLQNIGTKEQQLSLEFQDLSILKAKYTELLKAELPKDEEVKEDKAEAKK